MNGSATLNGNGNLNGNGSSSPVAKRLKVGPKEELADFDKVYKILMDECLNEGKATADQETGDAIAHFLRVCKYG